MFCAARENSRELFGGVKIILVGDYNQKKPVGEIATTSLMKFVENCEHMIFDGVAASQRKGKRKKNKSDEDTLLNNDK